MLEVKQPTEEGLVDRLGRLNARLVELNGQVNRLESRRRDLQRQIVAVGKALHSLRAVKVKAALDSEDGGATPRME